MKVFILFLITFAVFTSVFLSQSFSQTDLSESKIQELRNKLVTANSEYPSENIYLQLDRPSYWANDDIWYKAYLETQTDSLNIYVELISPSGKVLQKKIYLAIDGLAYGELHIPDTTSSGVYQIRAYSNWMRNFEENAFFSKNFIIWNLKDKIFQDKPEILNIKDIDLRFFPEGGTLLSGVKSILGFKAVDENGIGIDVEGIILDEQDNFVTAFKSLYKGMGKIVLIPENNKTYRAEVIFDNRKIRVDLPRPSRYGVSLTLEALTDQLKITLNETRDEKDTSESRYFIAGQTRGNMLFVHEIDLSNGYYGLKISKDKLPTGVLQVTLFDSSLMPFCERLTFINHNDFVQLDLQPNKETYTLREEVLVDISSMLKDSLPVISNLSFTAFSAENQLQLEKYPNNILTQFLLNSDLKGRIEEPAYYFKDNSRETLEAIDNLMLTQGWRRFTWKAILKNQLQPFTFENQSGIVVKGKVVSKFLEKPLPGSIVTLFFNKQLYNFHQSEANSSGQFYFDNLYFFDETTVLLKAKKRNGSKNVWIEVDDSFYKSPEVDRLPVGYTLKDVKKVNTTYEVSLNDSNIIKRKWHISDTILLDDIDVFGIRRKEMKSNDPIIFLNPDKTLQINHEEDFALNIFDYMQQNLPGVYIEDSGQGVTIRIGANTGTALLLLDGFPIESDFLSAMSFIDFDRIDVQRIAVMYGIKGNNGAINFTSRRGIKNVEAFLSDGLQRLHLKGYAVTKEFYSPDYSDSKPTIEKTDFRNTLYWNPNIWTSKNGKAKVDFFNSDQPGGVKIVVEGFTTDGRLCRGTCSYEVKF